MNDNVLTALVTGVAGIAAVLVIRWLLQRALRGYIRAVEVRRGAEEALSLRTRLHVLERFVIGFLFVIVAWQVLTVFPSTEKLGTALLASSAVLAAVVGLALSAPIGNVGAGVMLAFTQPVRIGDRITVEDVVGTVEEVTLAHTVLIDDRDRRIHVPNSRMVSSIVVNRSIRDPRRTVSVSLPIALGASIPDARSVLGAAAGSSERLAPLGVDVLVGDVEGDTVVLELVGLAPADANVPALASELRERGLAALGDAGLLPAG